MAVDTTVDKNASLSLDLRLFGTFDVRIQGQPMPPLRYRKEQWLLALIALRHDRDLSRDWLAATFWPENDESQGRFYLRKALSSLRSSLGPEAHRLLSPTSRTVRLDLSGAFADFLVLDAAVAQPRTDPDHEERLLEAVSLYRGPLLQECLEEWVILERESRVNTYLKALEALAGYALTRGEAAAATRWLRMAFATDPYRESTACSLMQVLADNGDRAAVQQVYQELRQRLRETLNAAPSPETEAVFKRGAQQKAHSSPSSVSVASPAAPRRHIPVPLTDLIGRDQEVEEVGGWLERRRLVTLLGPGGVGKTRLAIAVAEAVLPRFDDGVWFVDLAPLTEGEAISEMTARTLGVRHEIGRSAEERLTEMLATRSLLLILDNCEHLLDACALLADLLLTDCPELRILATSRQALGISGEQIYPVRSLALPSAQEIEAHPGLLSTEKNPAFLLDYASIQLFVQRAVQANPAFRLDRRNAQAVVEICRRLDGIPLAIEMAAARVRSLSVSDIQTRLSDRFRLLTSGSRSAMPRQQTLRAALDWSYELLNIEERELLDRLSVFVGGCSLEGATAVSGQENEGYCLDWLTSLTEKSLLVYDGTSDPPRYRMLETVRQYGQECLIEHEAMEQARALHAHYYSALGERLRREAIQGQEERVLPWIVAEGDNLAAALEYCMDGNRMEYTEQSMQLCECLYYDWKRHDVFQGRKWTDQCLALPDADRYPEHRAILLSNLAALCCLQGDMDEAVPYGEESVALARSLDNSQVLAQSVHALAFAYRGQNKNAEALALYEESQALYQQFGNSPNAIVVLANQAFIHYSLGNTARAYALLEESLAQYRAHNIRHGIGFSQHSLSYQDYLRGDYALAEQRDLEALEIFHAENDRLWESSALQNLGWINYSLGKREQAIRYCHASLRLQYQVGRKQDIAVALECLAFLAFDSEQWKEATCMWGADSSLREALKRADPQFHAEEYKRRLPETEVQLGAEAFQRAWTEGRQMSLNQCIDYGLACF
jgi:predicted ATPase/DNA-binding SARP family transcriptional activator